jgi:hypothetical protein
MWILGSQSGNDENDRRLIYDDLDWRISNDVSEESPVHQGRFIFSGQQVHRRYLYIHTGLHGFSDQNAVSYLKKKGQSYKTHEV